MNRIHNFKSLSKTVWLILIGTAFLRTITFMCMPFLTIYLSQNTNLSSFYIGVILGLGWILGIFGGFWGSTLSDIVGRKKVAFITLFIWSIVFLSFGLTVNIFLFIVLNILNGLCRSIFEPISQAILSDHTLPENKLTVFGYRYVAANIGAALGPLIGVLLSTKTMSISFYVASIVVLIYGFLILYIIGEKREIKRDNKVSIKMAFNALYKDVSLRHFIVAGTLIAIGVAQLDTLPLLLKQNHINNLTLYPVLLTVNALTVILLQNLISKISKTMLPLKNLAIGTSLFVVGLIGLGMSMNEIMLITFMFIFTVGEILILPLGSLLIDMIAPEHLRGAYFGANNFRTFGNAIGPMINGWLLVIFGGPLTFIIIGLIVLGSIIFYSLGIKISNKKEISNPLSTQV